MSYRDMGQIGDRSQITHLQLATARIITDTPLEHHLTHVN